ncbi:sialate O-acetylesterase [Haloferax marisrubri]|uniref:sialate O-acetylesterase n=1 Tax=Haloferax marisrubri TaxID=1544719 RepID=UPI0007339EC6|nr:sialate O-acetylesterase [Haloferax marisrubri]
MDFYLVAGQSNAVGKGTAAESPTPNPGTAFEFNGSSLVAVEDPVGGHFDGTVTADTGSMWPAFCREYVRLTGRHVAFVQFAAGGTAQAAEAGSGSGNWDVDGDLREGAADAAERALAHLAMEDYVVNVGGVLWSQGTRDAKAIDNGRLTAETYRGALETLLTYFRARLGVDLPFHIIQTGTPNDGDTEGFRAVREAQRAVVADNAHTYLASSLAETFASTGRMQDRVHYTQEGYNDLGRDVASTVTETLLASR